jgi:4-carboxymuconolactone decarboxylase
MTIHDDNLGGRLRLRNPAEMPASQKRIHDRLNAGMIQCAEGVPFRSKTSGDRLIGPFNPMLLSPNTTSGFLDFIESDARSTTLDARLREVVILTVGAVWKSGYVIYAHAAVARKAGLPEQAIRDLATGGCPDQLTDQEKNRSPLCASTDRRTPHEHPTAVGVLDDRRGRTDRAGVVRYQRQGRLRGHHGHDPPQISMK